MARLKILSCSSFLITDRVCPGTSVPCSTAACMFHSWSAFPKNGSILPHSNQVKKAINWFLLWILDPRSSISQALPVPSHMQGRPFLGKNTETKRKYVYGHRDRVDEVRIFARSVRDEKYLYIRNYMPHLGYNQPTAWPDIGEIRHEFYKLAKSGKMTPAQSHFAGPRRPIEELYDCENDPLNLKNLANSPKHQKILKRMRNEHLRYSLEIRDWGYIPEYEAWEMSKGSSGWKVGKSNKVAWRKNHRCGGASGPGKRIEICNQFEVRK